MCLGERAADLATPLSRPGVPAFEFALRLNRLQTTSLLVGGPTSDSHGDRECSSGSIYILKEEGSASSILGRGSFATVVQARREMDTRSDEVALKLLDGRKCDDSAVQREATCLLKAQGHPNVVGFHGAFVCQDNFVIVMDYALGGDLFARVKTHGSLCGSVAATTIRGVLAALQHIHTVGIVHRDVKPENVLLTGGACGKAVLADFGSACLLTDAVSMASPSGSVGYAAPEVLLRKPYGVLVDCFGAGAVLAYIIVGSPPFDARDRQGIVWKTCQCRPDFCTMLGADCKDLLLRLLTRSASTRATAAEALGHSWLSEDSDYEHIGLLPAEQPSAGCGRGGAEVGCFHAIVAPSPSSLGFPGIGLGVSSAAAAFAYVVVDLAASASSAVGCFPWLRYFAPTGTSPSAKAGCF